ITRIGRCAAAADRTSAAPLSSPPAPTAVVVVAIEPLPPRPPLLNSGGRPETAASTERSAFIHAIRVHPWRSLCSSCRSHHRLPVRRAVPPGHEVLELPLDDGLEPASADAEQLG